ncbi:hypothetical protein, partial [Bacillus cereus]
AILVDKEIMEIEKEIKGWKMVLNTTEFLCCFDKEAFFSSLVTLRKNMYAIRTILMVDDPTHGYSNPRYGIPLVKQRYHGRILDPTPPAPYYGGRLIHNYSHGNYIAGRHWSNHSFIVYMYPAFVLKFFYSPWNTAMKNRKLQIGPTLSKHSIQKGLGTHHLVTLAELETKYKFFASTTVDLRLIPEYQVLFPDLCFPNH